MSASALTEETSFGSNPGNLRMYLYAPAGMPATAPLVVSLHGCGQSAAAYVNAGWNELADLARFYVVYAEQPSSNNAQDCFDWFDASDIGRGAPEPTSIVQMVDAMKAKYSIDSARVFVTGLSAGGAMTSVLLATYPDVFAAGAVMAGVPYGCATSQSVALQCMMPGAIKTPKAWGDLVRNADPGYQGALPRLSVWQGASDYTVAPANQAALVAQWTDLHGLTQTATTTATVDGASYASYADAQGRTQVESFLIPKMAHGTALKVGFAPAGGCGQTGAYLLDVGICSTYWAGVFFGVVDPATVGDGGTAADDLGGSGGGGGGATGGGGSGEVGGGGPGGSAAGHGGGGGCSFGGAQPERAKTALAMLLFGLSALGLARSGGRWRARRARTGTKPRQWRLATRAGSRAGRRRREQAPRGRPRPRGVAGAPLRRGRARGR